MHNAKHRIEETEKPTVEQGIFSVPGNGFCVLFVKNTSC